MATREEIADILAGFTLFGDLQTPQLLGVASVFDEVVFPANERILRQGLTGSGFFVILDGVVRPDWLPAFTVLARPLHYIVLRTTAAEAIERCLVRGGDSLSDPLVVADLYAQFADLGVFERQVLPVSGMEKDQALQSVINALQSACFRIGASGKSNDNEHAG